MSESGTFISQLIFKLKCPANPNRVGGAYISFLPLCETSRYGFLASEVGAELQNMEQYLTI